MMNIKNVVVAGGGVLGSQIAYQTAYKGFSVTMWLRSGASVERSKPKVKRLLDIYLSEIESMRDKCGSESPLFSRGLVAELKSLTPEKIDDLKKKAEDAFQRIKYVTNLEEAVKDADLVIESVAEDVEAKKEFYTELAKYLPEKTILVTNSSTMVPSAFADYTGRPEKYLALHFANEIWKNNTAEIMGHDRTDPVIYEKAAEFAADIGMVPLKLKKEQPGYILNSMLVPFLNSAQALFVNGVADPQTIDLTWMMATGAPLGPFRILDIIGLTTAYNIVSMNPEVAADPDSVAARISRTLKEYIDAGKTGINAGEGFYQYK